VWRIPGAVGRWCLGEVGEVGRASRFLVEALTAALRPPFRHRELLRQVRFIGNQSLLLILLAASFTGMVLTLQGHIALSRFGSTQYLGPLVALSLIRELGPVLGALMVTARAGSAIAATLGTMQITEQVDALASLAVHPLQYLVTPRLLAALVAVPLLTSLYDVTGILAGYLLGVAVLQVDGGVFMSSIREAVSTSDVSVGLWKSLVFAVLIVWVAAYRGTVATQGALGVGRATTRAVVTTTVLILAADYVMTALLF